MTIERIDQNKIKVTVNKKEQQKYGIDYDSMTYSDINTRKFCEKIISAACREVGFLAENSKLLVEAKRSTDGDVTLFLSKLPRCVDEREDYFCQTLCFKDASSLMDACGIFAPVKKKLVYSSLFESRGKYYLYFEIYSTHILANRILRDLLEYSERSCIQKQYLEEHFYCVAKDDALFKMVD